MSRKPELSKKNPYWLNKHRFYELQHFCLQYPEWKKEYLRLNNVVLGNIGYDKISSTSEHGDPTAKYAIERTYYADRITMVARAAEQTDPVLGEYVLIGVTENVGYDTLKMRYDIPCCKDVYYNLYRKFFWLLDKVRG